MIAGAPASGTATDHLYTTSDGGQSWTSLPMPTGGMGSPLLSCATTSTCVAIESDSGIGGVTVGNASLSTTDGGQSWSQSPLPTGFDSYSLQCFASGRCVATGDSQTSSSDQTTASGIYSTNNGGAWSFSALPKANSGEALLVIGLSCGDAEHCIAVEHTSGAEQYASKVLSSDDGGQIWSVSGYTSSSPVLLGSSSCSSATDCWAAGTVAGSSAGAQTPNGPGYIMATHDAGQTWSSQPVPNANGTTLQNVEAISCPTDYGCLALAEFPNSSGQPQNVVLSNEATASS
jgi:photosystem II stability/assembly factor-like uncharacterized protein